MSGYTKMNHRQPVDFCKQDHMQTVEHLRRLELKWAFKRNVGIEHHIFRERNGGNDYSSTSSDDCGYPETEKEFKELNDKLIDIYMILSHYYKYDEEWFSTLVYNKMKFLIIDLDKCAHDGFWGKDPTK